MWYNVKALAIGKPHKCQVTGNTLSQKPRKESVVRVSEGKQAKRKNRIEKQKLNKKNVRIENQKTASPRVEPRVVHLHLVETP